MIAAVCIDDNSGMTFNHRRQSRDRVLIDNFVTLCGEKKIRMNAYSAALFTEYADRIEVSEDFLEQAGEDDICFVETNDLVPYADRVKGLILYRWRQCDGDFLNVSDENGCILWQALNANGQAYLEFKDAYQRGMLL